MKIIVSQVMPLWVRGMLAAVNQVLLLSWSLKIAQLNALAVHPSCENLCNACPRRLARRRDVTAGTTMGGRCNLDLNPGEAVMVWLMGCSGLRPLDNGFTVSQNGQRVNLEPRCLRWCVDRKVS